MTCLHSGFILLSEAQRSPHKTHETDHLQQSDLAVASRLRPQTPAAWTPAVDVIDSEKEFKLLLDLPGVDDSSVEAKIEEGVLRVSGERKGPGTSESSSYLRRERAAGAFERSFKLPEAVDADGVEGATHASSAASWRFASPRWTVAAASPFSE